MLEMAAHQERPETGTGTPRHHLTDRKAIRNHGNETIHSHHQGQKSHSIPEHLYGILLHRRNRRQTYPGRLLAHQDANDQHATAQILAEPLRIHPSRTCQTDPRIQSHHHHDVGKRVETPPQGIPAATQCRTRRRCLHGMIPQRRVTIMRHATHDIVNTSDRKPGTTQKGANKWTPSTTSPPSPAY